MLEYDRIDISEGIDVNKTSAPKKCDICHYWYEPYLCNGFQDLINKAISFNDVTIVYVKESHSRIHFCYISKNNAISIMSNTNLVYKKGVL